VSGSRLWYVDDMPGAIVDPPNLARMRRSTALETTIRRIDRGWRVRESPPPGLSPSLQLPWIPAQVPGHVHLDLERAGVIPDPFARMHERGVAWVDETDWVYETTFNLDAPPDGEAFLLFHGLDTVAEIALNGEPVGQADNMFISHSFPVGDRLRVGENQLSIVFRSAKRTGLQRLQAWEEEGHTSMPHHWNLWCARSFVRKAQYMFGWDWGPELISCGIWQPVELMAVPVARLADWRYDMSFEREGRATLTIEAIVERVSSGETVPLTLTAALSALGVSRRVEVPFGAEPVPVSITLTLESPARWWPNGAGSGPALHGLDLTLESGPARVDGKQAKVGFRTVELVRKPDADGRGEGFVFRVNGENIFCKGANWIPADSFPSRTYSASSPRMRALLTAARDAGFNMLRIWGGGLYESDHFYDLCDELGILVWQDFPYACAYYPDQVAYGEAARTEATAAVRRLRVHPSLALWCGNNENYQVWHDNWNGLSPARFLGQQLYESILPRVVEAEDPGRAYWPGSPYLGNDPNSPDFGDRHNWSVWHAHGESDGDWTYYRTDFPRFCSEFGFAASCGLAAWDSCLTEADRSPFSPAVRWHDKTRKEYDTYLGYIERHFPRVRSLEDLVYFSQLNQAEALRSGVEHYRRLKGRCWGTLFWQLEDCWPVQSWSVIDYAGEAKAAYYAAKRFYAPVLLSLVEGDDGIEAHLTNDHADPVAGDLALRLLSFRGELLSRQSLTVSMDPNSTGAVATFPLDDATGHEHETYLLASFSSAASKGPCETVLFLAEPKNLRLPDPRLKTEVMDVEAGLAVRVEAEAFAPYVWLSLANAGPVQWEDNFFHLGPGESRIVLLQPERPMTPPEVSERLRVRTLDDGASSSAGAARNFVQTDPY